MSDIIQLLPDSVANQIAAGEVIQRPASVVKELVENAIDAEATTIDIIVVDSGRTLIQVIDNGKGMSDTDARLSFERHATSKIRKATDLFSLRTMGFRGEALASIAAVAQVELKTKQANDEIGTVITISGGRVISQEKCSSPKGSSFKVENLFFNVPARRKFLKSNTTELNNIISAFERIALVYENISFTLHSNGIEMFSLRKCSLKQRIMDVFGKRLNQNLLPLNVDTSLCKITGFIGKPQSAKKKGALQYFFVNQRYMKHPYFHKAVMTAFDRLVPFGEQVPYFIYFDVPTEDIDVNIHPTKTEIKFQNEQPIWQILLAGIKESIAKFSTIPSIDFNNEGCPDIPVFNSDTDATQPTIKSNPSYNPFQTSTFRKPNTNNAEALNDLYNVATNLQKEKSFVESQDNLVYNEPTIFNSKVSSAPLFEDKSPSHYQYKGCYIMTAVKSGLMIIDQHNAHVRILYEQYINQISKRKNISQKLLFPEVIQLSIPNKSSLSDILSEMQALGFDISDIGNESYAVNAVPSGIEVLNIQNLVAEIIENTISKKTSVKEDIDHSIALNLANNAAIPKGQVLSNKEMESIVNSLFSCSNVNYTPNGNPIIAILKQNEIEHLFI